MPTARFFVFAIALAGAIASACPIDVTQRDSDEMQDLFVRGRTTKPKIAHKSPTLKGAKNWTGNAATAFKQTEQQYNQAMAKAHQAEMKMKMAASQMSSSYAKTEAKQKALWARNDPHLD